MRLLSDKLSLIFSNVLSRAPKLQQPTVFSPLPAPEIPRALAVRRDKIHLNNNEKEDFLDRAGKVREAFLLAETPEAKVEAIKKQFDYEAAMSTAAAEKVVVTCEYLQHPKFQQLVRTLVDDTLLSDYKNTRKLNGELIDQRSNIFMGVFKSKIIEGLENTPSFEAMTFDHQEPLPSRVRDEFTSPAVALKNTRGTQGFASRLGVGTVFAGDWFSSEPNDPTAHAIYFVDRFEERFQKYVVPILDKYINANSFPTLRKFKNDTNAIREAATARLTAHENRHKVGILPREYRGLDMEDLKEINDEALRKKIIANAPFGFKLKNTRETGGFGELESDLCVIISFFSDALSNDYAKDKALLAGEMVLMDRLYRYAQQADPNENFDSLTALAIWNALFQREIICLDEQGNVSMQDTPRVLQGLKDFKSMMDKLQLEISLELDLSTPGGMEEGRARMKDFMRYWACLHEKNNTELQDKIKNRTFDNKKDYTLTPFHTKAKKELYGSDDSATKVTFEDLLINDELVVYGDRLKPDATDAEFVEFIKGLGEKEELAPGDALLKSVVAGHLDNVTNISPALIQQLANDTEDLEIEKKVARILYDSYIQDSGLKAYDSRFVDRLWRIIRHKYDICIQDHRGSDLVHSLLEIKKLNEELQELRCQHETEVTDLRRRGRVEMLRTTAVAAGLLACGIGGVWLTSVSSKPKSTLEDVPNQPVKSTNFNSNRVEVNAMHEAVKPTANQAQPEQATPVATQRPKINTTPGKLASVKIGSNQELQFDYGVFKAPPGTDEKYQATIKEFLQELIPKILERAKNQEMLLPAKTVESIDYAVMLPDFPHVGLKKIQVWGFSFGKLNVRISPNSIYEIVDGKTTAKKLVNSPQFEITSPDFQIKK